uniref:F-box domain-containing protein n=1 Tax=Steinernema glaseri TaxID=37863 RepID=A0A1I7YAV9_9BILA
MESVPVAFIDGVCHLLEYHGYLRPLTELSSLWSSTAETHYKKRRRFTLYLNVNDDGTQVGMEIRTKALPLLASLACSYLFGNVGSVGPYRSLMELLFSSLHGHVTDLCTWNSGGECVKFIKKQVDLGYTKNIELYGEEGWPQSLKSTFKSFMKSPKFEILDIFETNLNVDLDIVTCLVELFVKGDLPDQTSLVSGNSLLFGTPSFSPEMLRGVHQEFITTHCADGDFHDYLRSPVSDFINWARPGPLMLSAVFFEDGHFSIALYNHELCDCSNVAFGRESWDSVRGTAERSCSFRSAAAKAGNDADSTVELTAAPRHHE